MCDTRLGAGLMMRVHCIAHRIAVRMCCPAVVQPQAAILSGGIKHGVVRVPQAGAAVDLIDKVDVQ